MKEEIRKLVEEAETRAEKATAGPWAWEAVGSDDNEWCLGMTDPPVMGEIVETFDEEHEQFDEKPTVVEFVAQNGTDGSYADAEFIAHARQDVPALCAAIRETDAENEKLRSVFEDLLKDWQGLVDNSQTIGDGARDGVRMCIKMLKKAKPTAP